MGACDISPCINDSLMEKKAPVVFAVLNLVKKKKKKPQDSDTKMKETTLTNSGHTFAPDNIFPNSSS